MDIQPIEINFDFTANGSQLGQTASRILDKSTSKLAHPSQLTAA